MAPELGLFLDECFFDAYNKQWGELHSVLKLSDYQAEVDAFKVGTGTMRSSWVNAQCPGHRPFCCSVCCVCCPQSGQDTQIVRRNARHAPWGASKGRQAAIVGRGP